MWDCQFILYINIYDNIDMIKKNLKKIYDLCVLSRAYIPNALLRINNLSSIREQNLKYLILKLEYILDLM